MYCLLGVAMNHWSEYSIVTRALKAQVIAAPEPLSYAHPAIFDRATGFLLLIDWDAERILGYRECPKPFGFTLDGNTIYVNTWGNDDIIVIHGNDIVARIQHPWFNHLHTIEKTKRGLLVTSSGLDLIAEIDDGGRLLWECFMFEHGYNRAPYLVGQHFVRSRNYNRIYIPSNIKAHVNSAILVDEDTVLATLFDPGEVVRIDRRTRSVDVVVSGLRRPHSIRRRAKGGYLVSNTEGEAVILLDHELRREGEVRVGVPWIQDANLVESRLMVVANRRVVTEPSTRDLAEDAMTTGQVLEFALDGTIRKCLDMGHEHRLYLIEPVTTETAIALADAWRDNYFDASIAQWHPPRRQRRNEPSFKSWRTTR